MMPGRVVALVALLAACCIAIALALVVNQPGATRTVLFAGPESAEMDLGAGPELGFGRSSFGPERPAEDVSADGKWFRSSPSARWKRASALGDPVHDMNLAHIAREEARRAVIFTNRQRHLPRLRAEHRRAPRSELMATHESEDENPRCSPLARSPVIAYPIRFIRHRAQAVLFPKRSFPNRLIRLSGPQLLRRRSRRS